MALHGDLEVRWILPLRMGLFMRARNLFALGAAVFMPSDDVFFVGPPYLSGLAIHLVGRSQLNEVRVQNIFVAGGSLGFIVPFDQKPVVALFPGRR